MNTHSRLSAILGLSLFLLGGVAIAPLSAQSGQAKDKSVYLGLMGGYAHSENQGGMADFKAEILVPLYRCLGLG